MAARRPAPLRSNISRFVVAAFLLQLVAMSGVLLFVQQMTERALVGQEMTLATELRDELLDAYRAGGQAEVIELIVARIQPARGNAATILLTRKDGIPIAGNLDAWPTVLPTETAWRTIDLYRTGRDHPERIGVVTTSLPDGTRLLTGHAIDASIRLARANERALLAALFAGLSLTFGSALVLGRMLSRQIERIVATTRAVEAGALAQRVPISGSGDAFDSLGTAINSMLERIDALVLELRITSDSLAHDLRSPVTRLRSAIEQAMALTNDAAMLAALEKAAAEADGLLSMLSRALLISGAEAGIGRQGLAEVSVDTLLADIAEVYGPLAEEEGFTITIDAPPGLRAMLHRELMSQAIGNLVENALNYASGGHRIELIARKEEGELTLIVGDDGPGIAPADRAEALRRFGRLDRARQTRGAGLGLPLVAAVVRLHEGSVELTDNHPGLRVLIRLRS